MHWSTAFIPTWQSMCQVRQQYFRHIANKFSHGIAASFPGVGILSSLARECGARVWLEVDWPGGAPARSFHGA